MDRFSEERLHWAFVMAGVLALGGAIAAALSGNMLVPIAIVLVAALAKARIVILDFMALRRAPLLWLALTMGWIIVVWAVLSIAYIKGLAQ